MQNSNSKTITFGEIQLSYHKKETTNFIKIQNSQDSENVLRSIFPIEQICYRERMYALYLNNNNLVIGYHLISIGGITGTIVDVRIVLQGLLLCNGVGLILSHNHPSGKLKPSQADIAITNKIKKACQTMDIKLLDHIILTEDNYYSFADEGDL